MILEDDAREEYPYDAMVDFIDDDLPYSMSLSEGFAQVYVNQQWGPVCKMQKEDADVFCRQLSFTNAVSVQEFSDMYVSLYLKYMYKRTSKW